jgi:FdhD protein
MDAHSPGAVGSSEGRFRDGATVQVETTRAVETPIALQYNGIAHAVMLATPCDLEDFGLGFSLGEGIVADAADVYGVEVVAGALGYTVEMDIATAAFAGLKQRRRTLAGRTGCGICGTESLDQVLRPLPRLLPGDWRLEPRALARAAAGMAQAQPLGQATGATHAAAWYALDGTLLHLREDVGRHNALDKLVGALVRAHVARADGFALITSRASVEMVQKAATAGMGLLAAVSGPTALAVETAQACGLTLLGFVREARFSVYAHPERLAPEAQSGPR